jgi:hypothetical protein
MDGEFEIPGLDKDLSSLDQDLKEFSDFYSRLAPNEKQELKRLIDEAVSATAVMSNHPGLRQLHFRIGFSANSRYDESDQKLSHLSIRTLRRAIEAWEKGRGYAPSNEHTITDDLWRP